MTDFNLSKVYPGDVRTAGVQEGVGRQVNQPHHQQSSGRLFEAVVPDRTAQDGVCRLDPVHASILRRVAVRIAL